MVVQALLAAEQSCRAAEEKLSRVKVEFEMASAEHERERCDWQTRRDQLTNEIHGLQSQSTQLSRQLDDTRHVCHSSSGSGKHLAAVSYRPVVHPTVGRRSQ